MPTVLLIDDEQPELDALARAFREHDWDVVTANNGTRAAALASERAFDLVVSDIVMEGLVGAPLLEAIRATRGGERAAFVFTSVMPERRVRRIVPGDYLFVAKPASYGDIVEATGLLDGSAAGHVAADQRVSL